MQWAAVSTHCGAMRVPPQVWDQDPERLYCSEICKGKGGQNRNVPMAVPHGCPPPCPCPCAPLPAMASCGLRRLHRPPHGSSAVVARRAGRTRRLCDTRQRDIRGCLCPCPGPWQAPRSCPPCPDPSPRPAPTIAQQHEERDESQHGCGDQRCHSGAAHPSYGICTAGDLGVTLPVTAMWGLSHAVGTGAPQPHCPPLSPSPSCLGTATSACHLLAPCWGMAGTWQGHLALLWEWAGFLLRHSWWAAPHP